jgi:hypothetical protein
VKQPNLCTNCTQRRDLSGIRAQKRDLAGIRVQRDELDTTRVRFVRVRGWIHPGGDNAGGARRCWIKIEEDKARIREI